MTKYIDAGSLVVAVLTLVLFVAALFAKGLSHDMFLEAGVFLISVKVMLMAHKNSVGVSHLNAKLDRILEILKT